MTLTKLQRDALYLLGWQEPPVAKLPKWLTMYESAVGPLVQAGLLRVEEGHLKLTSTGLDTLSPDARTALKRPKGHFEQPESDQWATDKRLGILDWDGT